MKKIEIPEESYRAGLSEKDKRIYDVVSDIATVGYSRGRPPEEMEAVISFMTGEKPKSNPIVSKAIEHADPKLKVKEFERIVEEASKDCKMPWLRK